MYSYVTEGTTHITNPFHATDRDVLCWLPCRHVLCEVRCSVLIINTHKKATDACVHQLVFNVSQAGQNYVSSQFGKFRNLGSEIDVAEYGRVRVRL
jgi:hypothetical protein